jgi:hypothetical protein
MSDEFPETAAEVAAARQEFLTNPPAEVVDEVVAPVVDDAALETEAIDELTKPPADGGEGAPAPAPAPAPAGTPDPYAQYGGQQAVQEAWQIQEALRTEPGVRALAAQSLIALGYSPEQVKVALDAQGTPGVAGDAQAPGVPDPFAGLEETDQVDVGSVKAYVAEQVKQALAQAEAQTKPPLESVQQAVLAQQQQQVRNLTDVALIETIGVKPEDPAAALAYETRVQALVQRGSVYYDPTQHADPNHIRSVIQRANAEFVAEKEAEFKAYIAAKKQARDSQPANIAGGAGTDGPLAEPKSLTEARKQAAAAGFFE